MQNEEEAFVAEQNFNNAPNRPPPPYEPGQSFRDSHVRRRDNAERQKKVSTEASPLLSRDLEDSSSVGSSMPEAEAIDDRGPPAWSGERDYEGRPWWNTPSVIDAVHGDSPDTLTDQNDRYFGCYRPSFSTPWPLVEASSPRSTLS